MMYKNTFSVLDQLSIVHTFVWGGILRMLKRYSPKTLLLTPRLPS